MELNLTTEQKLQSLQNAEKTLSYEIYNTLLRVGVDPEVFQASDIAELKVPGFDGEAIRLEKLLLSLSVVQAKLLTIQ